MKLVSRIAVLCAATASTLAPAFARSAPIYVNVPFSFTVADQQMAAGRYEISMDDNKTVMYIEGGGRAVAVLASPSHELSSDATPSLIFHSTGSGENLVTVNSDLMSRSVVQHPVIERRLTTR